MRSKATKTAIGVSAVLGSLGVGGAGFALVSGGTASAATTPTTATATSGKGQNLRRFLRRHTVDATVTVRTKNGYETINLVRGVVGAISASSITVNAPDGMSLTATINAKTKFHNTTEQQLATGDKVGVLAYEGVARWIAAPKTTTSGGSG